MANARDPQNPAIAIDQQKTRETYRNYQRGKFNQAKSAFVLVEQYAARVQVSLVQSSGDRDVDKGALEDIRLAAELIARRCRCHDAQALAVELPAADRDQPSGADGELHVRRGAGGAEAGVAARRKLLSACSSRPSTTTTRASSRLRKGLLRASRAFCQTDTATG